MAKKAVSYLNGATSKNSMYVPVHSRIRKRTQRKASKHQNKKKHKKPMLKVQGLLVRAATNAMEFTKKHISTTNKGKWQNIPFKIKK